MGDFTWEEVNRIVKGGNYGWPLHEGMCTSDCAGYIDPIHAYPHAGESAAVTGGPVYRGEMFPAEYQGDLFFGDYAKGFIKNADLDANGDVTAVHDFDDQAGSVVDLKVAPDGSLYYITYFPGALYRVTYNTASHLPVASASADVTKGVEPLTVHFSSAGSQRPGRRPAELPLDVRRRDDQHRGEPDEDLPGEGRLHRAPDGLGRRATRSPAQPIVIQVGLRTRADRLRADRGPAVPGRRHDHLQRVRHATRPASTSTTGTSRPRSGCTTARTSTRSSGR